ncbi:hypothetical protein PR048_003285 [Dryococelus australis]|uniref:Uncharacterized protein n=1 Tax=Dryococelus australis TaxID=614101 RepID=A0ABQ9IMN0_9NEOP|nr:hypothetical protein PR048_003285 [Dryococelus australis]
MLEGGGGRSKLAWRSGMHYLSRVATAVNQAEVTPVLGCRAATRRCHCPRLPLINKLTRGAESALHPLPPPPKRNSTASAKEYTNARGGVVVRLHASHLGEPGSISGEVSHGFLHVVIVPDDDVGRWVFSRISRFPRPCIPALLHTHIGSKDLDEPPKSLLYHLYGRLHLLASCPLSECCPATVSSCVMALTFSLPRPGAQSAMFAKLVDQPLKRAKGPFHHLDLLPTACREILFIGLLWAAAFLPLLRASPPAPLASSNFSPSFLEKSLNDCFLNVINFAVPSRGLFIVRNSYQGAAVAERLAYSPPAKANWSQSQVGPTLGSSQVVIVPGDAAGRRVFSGISGFPILEFRLCSVIASFHPRWLSRPLTHSAGVNGHDVRQIGTVPDQSPPPPSPGQRLSFLPIDTRYGRLTLPLPAISLVSPPFHSGAAPYSPRFTLIGSQDLDVKNRPNLFTHSLKYSVRDLPHGWNNYRVRTINAGNPGAGRPGATTLARACLC